MPEKQYIYSEPVPGDAGNYKWAVRFDNIDGYIGINQTSNGTLNRVLLSRRQIKALMKFAGVPKRSKAKA